MDEHGAACSLLLRKLVKRVRMVQIDDVLDTLWDPTWQSRCTFDRQYSDQVLRVPHIGSPDLNGVYGRVGSSNLNGFYGRGRGRVHANSDVLGGYRHQNQFRGGSLDLGSSHLDVGVIPDGIGNGGLDSRTRRGAPETPEEKESDDAAE